ncbi:ABC transporter substrate-binding protein [Paralcaligenes ureilyticus]|uniref:ABC-type nitrate/sulfonate/bicarbonate transport system substrate-binding protein n=1 Tax=Paralcaligenes ureilyticus TaxID=627131 RepID=A0A4R3M957_9BURK|nr:ABC transporter substrate-binding protein [Paralcaligenes ureilyticus]TCT09652.1 ABC-type nitrate/sulfonate/bicarbonate transport system substrate-binding protein [Paralcaligenes ureilyticus]
MKKIIVSMSLGIAAIVATVSAYGQTKVTIGTSRDPNNGAQILIAEQKGFFRDVGLDVTVKYFPSGGDLMSAFVGGSIQYGSAGTIPVLTIRSRPFPLKVIAQMSDISGAQQLIVKKTVSNLDELRGKKIGLLRGTASEALYDSIVSAYKFNSGSATLINMGPTDMITAFVHGDVDAVALWEPHSTHARKLGNGKTLISGTYGYLGGAAVEKRIYGDHALLFANESTLKKQPAVARLVIAALQKANDFIQNNRAETIQIMAKVYGLQPDEVGGILDVNRYTLQLNDQLTSDMEKLVKFLLTTKGITHPVRIVDLFDSTVLRSVRPDLVKVP